MIYKQITREEMISDLICDSQHVYDIFDVPDFVDSLIENAGGQHMMWDREAVWAIYCELRRAAHEERH
jgi:hypothetical protein